MGGGWPTLADMTTPKPKRRWFQYSLRTLLVLMLLVGVGMSWVGGVKWARCM